MTQTSTQSSSGMTGDDFYSVMHNEIVHGLVLFPARSYVATAVSTTSKARERAFFILAYQTAVASHQRE